MADATIYYVRHGETDWNAELRYQGRQDIPLNEKGLRQARANGEKLARLLGAAPAMQFLSSPLVRTRQTMEILLACLGLEPDRYSVEPRLIEASYGDLEGTTLAEFKAADPEAHRQRRANRWTFCPPGGESHEMVSRRIVGWLRTIDRDTVIAGHGAVGRVIRQRILGLDPHGAAAFQFPQDRIFIWSNGTEKQI